MHNIQDFFYAVHRLPEGSQPGKERRYYHAFSEANKILKHKIQNAKKNKKLMFEGTINLIHLNKQDKCK